MVEMYPAYRAFVKVNVITHVTREIRFRAETPEKAAEIAANWTPDYITQVGRIMIIDETPSEVLELQIMSEEEWMKR